MQINILEAKNRLSELVKSAQSGEEVIIANRGTPVARLVPFANTTVDGHRIGSSDAILAALSRHRGVASRSRAEIDADLQRERDSWD